MVRQDFLAIFAHFSDLKFEVSLAMTDELYEVVFFECFFVVGESFIELQDAKDGSDEVAEHGARKCERSNDDDKTWNFGGDRADKSMNIWKSDRKGAKCDKTDQTYATIDVQ